MNFVFGFAVYFVCWWIILFAVLPFGVKTQEESGEVSPGTAESAPVAPNLLPKVVATTLITTVVFGIICWLIGGGAVTLEDIPFLPRFEHAASIKGN